MNQKILSIRPFIGSKNFSLSSSFYKDLGFEETYLFPNMSYFHKQEFGFYLQDAYVKEWVDNTMVFIEVENVETYWNDLLALDLKTKYETVKLVPIRTEAWGKEFFLHDPAGILWHFGTFFKK